MRNSSRLEGCDDCTTVEQIFLLGLFCQGVCVKYFWTDRLSLRLVICFIIQTYLVTDIRRYAALVYILINPSPELKKMFTRLMNAEDN